MDSMPKYESYKDSGVDWIGEVPATWEITRLGTRFIERRTKVSDIDYPPLSVTKQGILPQLDNAAKTKDGDNRKLVKSSDFVINSRSDRKGSSGVADRDGSVSLINIVLKPKGIYPKFSEHLLKSYAFIEEYYRVGRGIVADLWTTRYDEMRTIMLAIPSYEEQIAIADFIDQKTVQIDEAIAIKEKQIALLKERKQIIIQQAVTQGLDSNVPMKDTGVAWIGQIPEHWDVRKLKYGVKVQGGFAFQSSDFKDEGIQLLKIANLYQNRLALERQPTFISENLLQKYHNWVVSKGDILMSLTGTLGKRDYGFAILLDSDQEYFLNQRVARLTANELFETRYLTNLLQSESYLNQIYQLPAGTKQANLSNDNVVNAYVPVPTFQEQVEIADFIEARSRENSKLISSQMEQIEKLKEYKATLINSAVTGKIKVA